MDYQTHVQGEKLRKGPWIEEEDERLTTFVTLLGERKWDSIAKASGLRRSGKSCRLRWLNYLRPNLKRGHISPEEEKIILQLHERWGNKWSMIARRLPGRTDNEIKNYWRTHLRRKTQAQEAESFECGRDDEKQDSLYEKVDTEAQNYSTGILGNDENYFEAIGLSNCGITSSPYEARLSNWISELSNNQNEVQQFEEFCGTESCSFYSAWFSEDTDLWCCSGFLWNMD